MWLHAARALANSRTPSSARGGMYRRVLMDDVLSWTLGPDAGIYPTCSYLLGSKVKQDPASLPAGGGHPTGTAAENRRLLAAIRCI